jgi:hypothetical protein
MAFVVKRWHCWLIVGGISFALAIGTVLVLLNRYPGIEADLWAFDSQREKTVVPGTYVELERKLRPLAERLPPAGPNDWL